MASYRGHLMLAVPLGAAYSSLTLLQPEWDWGPVFLGAGFCAIGGVLHSLPAMLIAGLTVHLVFPTPDLMLRLYLSGAVMVGFLSHLVLDEFCAVDFNGVRVKFNKFAGSALKFGSHSWVATLTTY